MKRRVISWRSRLLAGLLACAGTMDASAGAAGGATPAAAWRGEHEVFYLVFVRSFADSDGDRIGDFHGIEERLGYLQALGVTAILLTPVVPSTMYHNYFTTRFDAVDPAYGDLAAFRHLVAAIHRRHMKVYLDEEIQYVEWGHPWWTESAGGAPSPYAGYILYAEGSDSLPERGFLGSTEFLGYDGRPARIAVVNLESPAVRNYFAGVFAWWLDPRHDRSFFGGVDGFRIDHMMDDLDHLGRLPHLNAGFWAPLFAQARAVNPAIAIIAEQADWQYGDDLLEQGSVDIVYAFPLRKAIVSLDRAAIGAAIDATQAHTPAGKGQLIFIENHDTDRFASLVDADPRKERIGAALNILLKGSPLIYYGQELGMKGRQLHGPATDGNDIPVREAFRWTRKVEDPGSAIWYRGAQPWWTERQARDDDGISVAEQRGRPGSLLEYYRRLLALRRAHPEIQTGDQHVVATDAPGLLAVSRALGPRQSLLIVNCSGETVQAHVAPAAMPALAHGARAADLLHSGATATVSADGITVTVAPFGVALFALR